MTHLLRFVAALVRWLHRSPAEREAEIVYLRQVTDRPIVYDVSHSSGKKSAVALNKDR
jgi:hypothetical protein